MKLAILIALLAGLGPMVQATNHMRRAAETLGDGTVERPSIRMYNATTYPALTSQEAFDLLYLVEEEKMTRDVIAFFWQRYDVRVFERIMTTERRHMNMIQRAMSTSRVAHPTFPVQAGNYTVSNLRTIYTDMTQDVTSLQGALLNSAALAEISILDLRDAISHLSGKQPRLATLYNSLLLASESHLRSFAGILELLDEEDYEAQNPDMDQEDVDVILHHGWHKAA
jgi:hypothetical protein